MASLHQGEGTTGVGVEVLKWVLDTLSLSRRSRSYRRLNAPVRKRVRLARLGKNAPRNTPAHSFKIRRLKLRLRLTWFSPFTLLAKLRDSYVHLLQAASNKVPLSEGLTPFAGPPCDFGPSRFPLADFKTKEREVDKFLELYLARTRSQLLLTNTPPP